MFTLGVLGIFQTLFFPGLMIKKFIQYPRNFFFLIASIVAFSLITNYLIVFLLTTLGIFIRWIVIFLFIIEMFVLLYLYRQALLNFNIGQFFQKLWNSIAHSIVSLFPTVENDENALIKVVKYGLMLASLIIGLIAIEWIFRFFRYNLGEVFNTWDAVVSWNRWAVDWASNHFPYSTQDYPQLIPANWALIYQFIGTTEIQFFSKAIMPLFPLLIFLMLLGLGFETRNPAFFLAIELTRLIIKKFSAEFIAAGYVDFSLTFFVLLSFIMLFLAYKSENLDDRLRYLFLSFIFVSGAVVTKQPGFFALFGIILITLLFVVRKDLSDIFKLYKKQILFLLIMMGLIIIPWYLLKGIQFLIGTDQTHLLGALQDTNRAHNNQSLFANLIPGLMSLGKYLYVVLFIIPGLFFMEKFWRIIALLITIPYVALWAAYASYDSRNLTMIYPFIAILFCSGLVGAIFWVLKKMEKLPLYKIPVSILLLISLLFAIGLSFIWSDEILFANQIEKQKMIFSSELNGKLYDYFSNGPVQGKILTNYPVNYLPGFEKTQKAILFQNVNEIRNNLEAAETQYVLYPSNVSGDIEVLIDDWIDLGKISVIFETDSWIPYTFARVKR